MVVRELSGHVYYLDVLASYNKLTVITTKYWTRLPMREFSGPVSYLDVLASNGGERVLWSCVLSGRVS